jgi:D-alanyl-D-alanine carboxypeptidase (penicillin-binding protein 5/6)
MSVPVKLGTADSVIAEPAEDPTLLMEKAQKNMVTTEIQLDESVNAPVSKGQKLGTLTVKAGEYVLKQIPLVAKEGVGRLTFGQIWSRILQVLTMSAKK